MRAELPAAATRGPYEEQHVARGLCSLVRGAGGESMLLCRRTQPFRSHYGDVVPNEFGAVHACR